MNTSNQHLPLLENDISDVLGLSHLSEADRQQYLQNVEALLLESACTRLVAHMHPPDREKIMQLATGYSGTDLLNALADRYPIFSLFYLEEVQAWRDEVRYLGSVA